MAQVTCMKRGNYWQYRFEGAKIGGKRKRFTKGGFATKKEAMQAGTKALAEYNGVYSVICQMFAQKNIDGNQFINREEDLGKEGLRKSKLSYQPYELLCKDIAVLKQ